MCQNIMMCNAAKWFLSTTQKHAANTNAKAMMYKNVKLVKNKFASANANMFQNTTTNASKLLVLQLAQPLAHLYVSQLAQHLVHLYVSQFAQHLVADKLHGGKCSDILSFRVRRVSEQLSDLSLSILCEQKDESLYLSAPFTSNISSIAIHI